MAFDKPNLILPLAASYDQRGNDGYETAVTNATDQRKVNSFYEPIVNAVTGKTTLKLCKRPGVTEADTTYGGTDQVMWQAIHAPASDGYDPSGAANNNYWIFFKDTGNAIKATNGTTTTTIATSATKLPRYVGLAEVSGTKTVVLEICLRTARDYWFANTIGSWTQITDGDCPTSATGHAVFSDGYMFVLSGRQIHNSNINSLANWTAGDFITKTIIEDQQTGLARLGKLIVAFGRESAEVFVNGGNAVGSPLRSARNLTNSSVGMTSPDNDPDTQGDTAVTSYYTVIGGVMYFVGHTTAIGNALWAFNGERFEKVSSLPIDKIIGGSLGAGNLSIIKSVNTIKFKGQTGIALGLTGPLDATQRWLMYFPDYKEWFEWTSTIFQPVNASGYFHLGTTNNPDNGYHFFEPTEVFQDNGTNYEWIHQFKLPTEGNHLKRMFMMGVDGDTARSAQSLSVQRSFDDYQNFETTKTIDMTSARKIVGAGGQFRNVNVRLSYTGALDLRLEKFMARID